MKIIGKKFSYDLIANQFNLLAGFVLVFNFLNPQLATAKVSNTSNPSEFVLKADPGSRLVRPEAKPRLVRGIITAYTSTPDQTDGNPLITASGKKVNENTIAANGVPFGTVVKIPSLFGNKRFIVTDRMNSRYGFGRFDVWHPGTRAEALRFGVKRVTVEIYYPDKELAIK